MVVSIFEHFSADPAYREFLNSAAWKAKSKHVRQQRPFCQRCELKPSESVHHVIPWEQCNEEQKFADDNLRALCFGCHNIEEAETSKPLPSIITGQTALAESEHIKYDARRGEFIERFAKKFCNHYRGSIAGQPFELHPEQTRQLRQVYGMIDQRTRRRHITQWWWESAIGTGKTPVMAICGLAELLASGENGAQVYSLSNTFKQASYSFETAKIFIRGNQHLSKLVRDGHLVVNQREIRYLPTNSKWEITSGTGTKAGDAATLLLVDEVHQIEDRDPFNDLYGRQTKRDQPLTIFATNAAKEPHAIYADLHELAEHCITGGPRKTSTVYATIWAAPFELDPGAPATWHVANPLIGTTIEETKVAQKWAEAKGSPDAEQVFRLQYLGQPVRETSRWLDIAKIDAASQTFDRVGLKDAVLYVGLDMSGRDDLCALEMVYCTQAKFFVEHRYWLPQATADAYEAKDPLITYGQWSKQKAITLLPQKTIDTKAHDTIAGEIIALHKVHPIKMLCYDRAYSGHVIEQIRAAGIPCEGVGQGWGVSKGCEELDRRLIDGSIVFQPSPVFRFCCDNAEVTHDNRGNYWPVKPNANHKTGNTGKRAKKIDGVSALVTALTKAREHDFPKAVADAGALLIDLQF